MRTRMLMVAVLGGVLLGIGSRFVPLWFCSLASFFPLTWLLAQQQSLPRIWWQMFLAGACAYGLSLHALFWDTLPLAWLGITGILAPALITCIWVVTTATFAATFAAGMTLAKYLLTRTWRDMFIIASCFVLADWIGTWLFSLVNYGPYALVGPHFTMGSPAYQLAADGVLVQTAFIGGIYALAFLQALIGAGAYYCWVRYRTSSARFRVWGGVLTAVLAVWISGAWILFTYEPANKTDGLQIALVTRYDQALIQSNVVQTDQFLSLVARLQSLPPGTDAVLFPEDTRFLQVWQPLAEVSDAVPLPPTIYIDSASVREADKNLYSQLTFYNAHTGATTHTYKQYLMVFGEYMPYIYNAFGTAIGQAALLEKIASGRSFHTKGMDAPVDLNSISVAIHLCSDAMSPVLYANQVRQGAQILFNLASHSWFHQSRTLYTTAVWVGKVRAVENHRWYARASNDTPSFILDPYGRIIHESTWENETILYGTVYPVASKTPYQYVGQLILLVPLMIIVYCGRRKLVRLLRK